MIALVLALVACGGGSDGPPPDAGRGPLPDRREIADTAPPPPMDAPIGMDDVQPPIGDAPPVSTDGPGTAGDGPAILPEGGRVCRPDPVTRITGSPCRLATRACIAAATTGAQAAACFAADGNPACEDCVNTNLAACANPLGCQGPWDCFSECVEVTCANNPSCVAAMCIPFVTAYRSCLVMHRVCEAAPDSCYMGFVPDGGTADGG